MQKIYNIKYFDSFFIYEKELPKKIELKVHECFGYVKEKESHLDVSFIVCELNSKKCNIEGLLIPKNALTTRKSSLKPLKINSKIAITWQDIVHFKNVVRDSCSTMYTEGILIKQTKDYIVVKNPETIRIHPKPLKNHPMEKPIFYIIHISVITDIEILK